jgi:hypothetical protein
MFGTTKKIKQNKMLGGAKAWKDADNATSAKL